MIVNDHYLKQHYGSWLTGKLSDAAGMVFFPALLAVLVALLVPRLQWRSVVVAATTTTAAGFVWVKATSMGADAASGLLTRVSGPSLMREDATDLLALPLLALAVWIAMRKPIASHWRVIAVLPVAVWASAATTAIPSEIPLQVTVVDDQLAVGTGYDSDNSDPTEMWWWTLDPHDGLTEVPNDDAQSFALRARSTEPEGHEECYELDPTICYRPYAGHLGVERSDDGGSTWSVDWQVPYDERELLLGALQRDPSSAESMDDLQTFDIAIVPGANGQYSVWAANGLDGLAQKDSETGEWSRVYGTYWDMEWLTPVPLPSEVPYSMTYPMGLPLLVFGVGLLISLAVIAAGFGAVSRKRPGALALFVIALCVGGFGALLALLVTWTGGKPTPYGQSADWLLGMSCALFLGFGGILMVIALGMAAKTRGAWAVLAAIGCAAIAATATWFMPSSTFWSVWAGLAIATVLSVGVFLLCRRLPPPPQENPSWPAASPGMGS
jgi:hypothetical protein